MRDGGTVDVKRNDVEQAADKARLDTPAPEVAPAKKGLFGRKKVREQEAQQQFRQTAGVEVDPETGLTDRQIDRNNGEARDEWQQIMLAEWQAQNPGADPQTAPNLYAPAMEEVRARRAEGRPPGPDGGDANKHDEEDRLRNKSRAASGAMTAVADFNPDVHPRGRDGKFIEKFRLVELFDHPQTTPGQRGQVTGIKPNSKSPAGRTSRSVCSTPMADRVTRSP